MLCAFVACHRSETPSPVDAAPSASPSSIATASETPVATPDDRAAKFASVLGIVAAWNDAHVTHDASALEALYAPAVNFYGASLSAADCAKKKRAAFKASPDYTQSVRDVKPDSDDAGRTFVRLTKITATKAYPAILVIDANGKIAEENDDLDENWCHDKEGAENNRVIAPFRMGAGDAVVATMNSKHVAGLKKPVGIYSGGVQCAKRCPIQIMECGFQFRLNDQSPSATPSNLIEWVYVEPVSKTLFYQRFGGSSWSSEAL